LTSSRSATAQREIPPVGSTHIALWDEAETLPGLREALADKDADRARAQAKQLGLALDRAIAALK
jgi:hypothetical protein